MDIGHYQRFLTCQQQGLKKPAAEAVRQFIDSFETDAEKSDWVWAYLPSLPINGQARIRHELFNELIFPLLFNGWRNEDWQSTLWLGKLMNNVYQTETLHRAMGYTTDIQLFQQCYQWQPNHPDVRQAYLSSLIRGLSFCGHEYPPIILAGNHAANIADCAEIRQEIELARALDNNGQYREFLDSLMSDVQQYEAGLPNATGA